MLSVPSFRIANKYAEKYLGLGLQEKEEVIYPLVKGTMKDEPSSTSNCYGGWNTFQNVVKWIIKTDPDNASERLSSLLNSTGSSLYKLDGENGSIRFLQNCAYEYWTRNIKRPGHFQHAELERFVTHLHHVTEGKINVVYYEEYSMFGKKPAYVIIGTGRTVCDDNEQTHIVDFMSAPLHDFIHDELLSCFGHVNPQQSTLQEFHYFVQSKIDTFSLFLVPLVQMALPVHELLLANAQIARKELEQQSIMVESGETVDAIKRHSKFEGMVLVLRTHFGDIMMKDKFGVHCETSFPPSEQLLPLLEAQFHDLFSELIALNKLSETIFARATANKNSKSKANKGKTTEKSSSNSEDLLQGRIEMAVKSATNKGLVGSEFNSAVVKDVLDSDSTVNSNKILGLMRKNKWFQQ